VDLLQFFPCVAAKRKERGRKKERKEGQFPSSLSLLFISTRDQDDIEKKEKRKGSEAVQRLFSCIARARKGEEEEKSPVNTSSASISATSEGEGGGGKKKGKNAATILFIRTRGKEGQRLENHSFLCGWEDEKKEEERKGGDSFPSFSFSFFAFGPSGRKGGEGKRETQLGPRMSPHPRERRREKREKGKKKASLLRHLAVAIGRKKKRKRCGGRGRGRSES